jgi:uncharacterized protein YacL
MNIQLLRSIGYIGSISLVLLHSIIAIKLTNTNVSLIWLIASILVSAILSYTLFTYIDSVLLTYQVKIKLPSEETNDKDYPF